jgi:hypothetical protein
MRQSVLHHGNVNFAYGVEEISLAYDIAVTLGIEEIPPISKRLICGDTNIKFGVEKMLELVRNLMAHAQKLQFIFLLNGRVHLNRRGCQFS